MSASENSALNLLSAINVGSYNVPNWQACFDAALKSAKAAGTLDTHPNGIPPLPGVMYLLCKNYTAPQARKMDNCVYMIGALVKAGASLDTVDERGWNAKDYLKQYRAGKYFNDVKEIFDAAIVPAPVRTGTPGATVNPQQRLGS